MAKLEAAKEKKAAEHEEEIQKVLTAIDVGDGFAEQLRGQHNAKSITKEKKALLGYVIGDLGENAMYELVFGMQTNDRPQDEVAVRKLAATMDGRTDRYNVQSHIKCPLEERWLTENVREVLAVSKEWDIESLHTVPGRLRSLYKLSELLEAVEKGKTLVVRKEGEMGGETDEDRGGANRMEVEGTEERHRRIVLKPVGGQHRTGAVRMLLKRYEKENRKDAGRLVEVEKDLVKAKVTLEEERVERRNVGDDRVLSSFEGVAQLTSEAEQLRAQLLRRAQFLKEGGSWLFAVYDDSEWILYSGGERVLMNYRITRQ